MHDVGSLSFVSAKAHTVQICGLYRIQHELIAEVDGNNPCSKDEPLTSYHILLHVHGDCYTMYIQLLVLNMV